MLMGTTFEEHLAVLQKVFLRSTPIRLKLKICRLIQTGAGADPGKVVAIQEFSVPHDLKALCSFLGLASYYRLLAYASTTLLSRSLSLYRVSNTYISIFNLETVAHKIIEMK